MGYEDPASWTPLQRAMALSTAQFTGHLPNPLDRPPTIKHPKVRVRSLVSNRFGPDGQVVQVGQVLELPSPEAAGWTRSGGHGYRSG